MKVLNHTGVPLTIFHSNDVVMGPGGTMFLREGGPTEPTVNLPAEDIGEPPPPRMVIRQVLDIDESQVSVFKVSYNQPNAYRPEFYRMDDTYWLVSRERAMAMREKGEYLGDILVPGRPVHKRDGTIVGYAEFAPA